MDLREVCVIKASEQPEHNLGMFLGLSFVQITGINSDKVN